MQSSQHALVAASAQDPDNEGPIASRTRSRKRTRSEMTGDTEELKLSFDIIKCIPDECRYVFQHLNAEELLEMSTVNRQWNTFVGERPQIGKLKLKIEENDDKKLTRKIKNVLMNSKRRYQNIEINFSEENVEFFVAFLAKGAGSWKFVNIWTELKFGHASFPKILEIIEPSVEDLDICDGYDQHEPSSAASSLTFPRLKHLKYDAFDSSVFKYFSRVTSLVSIRWYLSSRADATMALDLRTILLNNHNLKEMHVEAGDFRFFEHLPEIKLKLQKFTLYNQDEVESMQHLVAFLKTQASTLESLHTDLQLDQTLLEIILGMTRLTKLRICSISGEIQELPVNSTITSLKVDSMTAEGRTDEERFAYQKLIGALKNLKRFECNQIDNELFMFLLDVPELESIETDYFNVSRVPKRDVFPNIKEFKAHSFHRLLQEPTADHNFAKLVRDEMRSSQNAH